MHRIFTTRLAALALVLGIAAGAYAQTVPTPFDWPKNRVTQPLPGTYRLCILNTGANSNVRGISDMYANQLAIDEVRGYLGLVGVVWMADVMNAYTGRAYIRGPGEGSHWETLLYSEYFCRSFPAGTAVNVYAQIERSGWHEICAHGVTMTGDVTMMMTGPWIKTSCEFSPNAKVN